MQKSKDFTRGDSRKKIKKRSATAQNSGFAMLAIAGGAALAAFGLTGLRTANGGRFVRRREVAVAA